MKPVAPDALVLPAIRTRIESGSRRDGAVKARIEDRDLRNWADHALDRLDAFQFSPIVKRSKCCCIRDCLLNLRRDADRLFELGPAVNNAMSEHIDLCSILPNSRFATPE